VYILSSAGMKDLDLSTDPKTSLSFDGNCCNVQAQRAAARTVKLLDTLGSSDNAFDAAFLANHASPAVAFDCVVHVTLPAAADAAITTADAPAWRCDCRLTLATIIPTQAMLAAYLVIRTHAQALYSQAASPRGNEASLYLTEAERDAGGLWAAARDSGRTCLPRSPHPTLHKGLCTCSCRSSGSAALLTLSTHIDQEPGGGRRAHCKAGTGHAGDSGACAAAAHSPRAARP
jgi:hypothetical protein